MKRKFRQISSIFLCVSLLISLASCGNNQTNTQDEGSKAEESNDEIIESSNNEKEDSLTIWTTGDVGINPQIEQWNETHPNQQIEMVTADSEALLANLQTALAAGTGLPDAVWVECDSVENFKRNPDLWVNLFDYGAKELENDYLAWKWNQGLSTDGTHLFGMPTDIGPILLAYRTDIFEIAGLPTDRAEVGELLATWEDYIEVGKVVREKTGAYLLNDAAYMFQVIVGQGDEKFFDTDENCIVETNEQVAKAWKYSNEAVDSGISANMALWSSEWSTALGDGTLAVQLCPAWMVTHIKSYSEENAGNWDFTYLPEGGGNWGGSFACIPKAAEHPEAAYEFITWALSTEEQYNSYQSNQLFPSATGVYEMEKFKSVTDEFFNDAPVSQMFSESAEQLIPAYEGVYSKDVLEIMKDAVSRFENDTQTPEESWEQSLSEINRLVR